MIIADLQIHSRYARACSNQITLALLEKYARMKGLHLIGTGDFQHPKWYQEITTNLKEDEHGILRSTTGFPFLWQTEISLMYSQGGKGRRIHHLIFAPNGEVAKQIIEALGKKGRLDYDGRPIFGFSSIELVDMMLSISKDIEIIPAHIWTSWFGLLGSKSGFDSVEECFQERSKYIHALETGMSSDPAMNWRISSLDNYNLVSFSDAHSMYPWRIGREATIFDCDLQYKEILKAIRTTEGLYSTIETYPEYGKYHIDGHRACNVVLDPQEANKLGKQCPVCKKELTIGVLNRVQELADRPEGFRRTNAVPFSSVVPLTELIQAVYGIKQPSGKRVWEIYNRLIAGFGSEFQVLLHATNDELVKVVDARLAAVILKNRNGTLQIKPGADGVYGTIILENNDKHSQSSLSQF